MFWQFEKFPITYEQRQTLSSWRLTFSYFRFGKHRKDEQPEDKMEKKGSTKSKTEEVRAVEEKTQHMRLENERWGVQFSWLENLLSTQLAKWSNKVWVVFESTPMSICGMYTSIHHKDHL